MINLKFNKRLRLYPSYGLLYNWHAVNDSRGLAPYGWHIPTVAEIITLRTYLGGAPIAGGKLKEIGLTHWTTPNTGATDDYGFKALPGGSRHAGTGVFSNLNNIGFYYLSDGSAVHVTLFQMSYISTVLWDGIYGYGPWNLKYGFSVRCMRDTNTGWATGEQVIDYEGNIYDTVQIGTQIWLKQNLAVTHYKDGTIIPEVTDNVTWAGLLTGALCSYNNDWNDVFRN